MRGYYDKLFYNKDKLEVLFLNLYGDFFGPFLIASASCTNIIAESSSLVLTTSKTHDISRADLENASQYWNTNWRGRSSELYDEILALAITYFQTHKYVFRSTDCNDMVVDVW